MVDVGCLYPESENFVLERAKICSKIARFFSVKPGRHEYQNSKLLSPNLGEVLDLLLNGFKFGQARQTVKTVIVSFCIRN